MLFTFQFGRRSIPIQHVRCADSVNRYILTSLPLVRHLPLCSLITIPAAHCMLSKAARAETFGPNGLH